MTRMHFNALANALASERPGDNWDANKRVQWNQDVKAIASVCNQFNNGFDRSRFIDACGGLFSVYRLLKTCWFANTFRWRFYGNYL